MVSLIFSTINVRLIKKLKSSLGKSLNAWFITNGQNNFLLTLITFKSFYTFTQYFRMSSIFNMARVKLHYQFLMLDN